MGCPHLKQDVLVIEGSIGIKTAAGHVSGLYTKSRGKPALYRTGHAARIRVGLPPGAGFPPVLAVVVDLAHLAPGRSWFPYIEGHPAQPLLVTENRGIQGRG